ncbi:unnamed protein product [Trichobilharzia regenti]|nr:unnamed protein product [Trichobilharzia regenti]
MIQQIQHIGKSYYDIILNKLKKIKPELLAKVNGFENKLIIQQLKKKRKNGIRL